MTPRLSTWYRDAVAVERGPLVYSLRLDEEWKEITTGMKHPAVAPAKDWEVRPRLAVELRTASCRRRRWPRSS